MKFKRILPILMFSLLTPFLIKAQVTTSSITGRVTSVSGEQLEGATISAVHIPSGTVVNTISRKGGLFDIDGLRVGGPYSVSISYVGYETQKYDNVVLLLGEPYQIDATLPLAGENLQNIIIEGLRGTRVTTLKTGASTIVNSELLATLPTINRSLSDFTRITPQSSGSLGGFAGRDGRFNNLQVDGANLNNSFGLSSDIMPGGGASPISVDALQEVSVNIAPYDVRQSGFTGAGINAVTKSGTNTFHGTAYYLFRNENLMGDKINKQSITKNPLDNKTYGASVGGPIIKNKLFFFINAEHETRSVPGITLLRTGHPNRVLNPLPSCRI